MVTEDNEELNQPKLGVVPRIAILGISVFLMLSSSADVTCKYCGQKRQSGQKRKGRLADVQSRKRRSSLGDRV